MLTHVDPCSPQTGLTALHVAAQFGQLEFVREMLSQVPATVRSEAPHVAGGEGRDMEVGSQQHHTPFSDWT